MDSCTVIKSESFCTTTTAHFKKAKNITYLEKTSNLGQLAKPTLPKINNHFNKTTDTMPSRSTNTKIFKTLTIFFVPFFFFAAHFLSLSISGCEKQKRYTL